MQQKSDPHIFSGMQRDTSVSKHKAESLYDAMNIRFTARDGDTLLSITNEKGTLLLSDLSMQGTYLGHCVINDYVVVFTHNNNSQDPDYIYKITPTTVGNEAIVILYNGNLGFDVEHPIETLGVYENDNIQKVYWTDGNKQPRMINVCNVKYNSDNDTQFDFVATLDLNEDIKITRKDGSGTFAPGTIQYAFSYYNKYGRQSNIFYTTPLYYISYNNRGGSPEDTIANTFIINVDNVQKDSFDYLRVYSIHRTSFNATPTARKVVDVELATIDGYTACITDDGIIGNIIDYTELLYIGGEIFSAQTISQKDNTIFFGNLNLKRLPISSSFKEYIKNTSKSLSAIAIDTNPIYGGGNPYYDYYTYYYDTPGFKVGEHYRLGIQFQHKSGKWSEPIPLGEDYIIPSTARLSLDFNKKISIRGSINIEDYIEDLQGNDYVKYREVCVFPSISDRLVLTQGILNPTVFNFEYRNDGTPFAQSSWFFRPNPKDSDNNLGYEFRHNHSLSNEIQLSSNYTHYAPSSLDGTNVWKTMYGVDQSILTMHSPEIEFDDSFKSLEYTNFKLRLVGIANMGAQVYACDIQTSTPRIATNALQDNKQFSKVSKLSADSIQRPAFTYSDNIIGIYREDNVNKYGPFKNITKHYKIYPWQKSGPLNNEVVRPSDGGTTSSVLKNKKISSLKFFHSNTYFSNNFELSANRISVFDSDQLSLLKIPYLPKSNFLKSVCYYGNVDTMVSSSRNSVETSDGSVYIPYLVDDLDNYTPATGDNIPSEVMMSTRIKYKSTRHLVFSLMSDIGGKTTVMPILNNTPSLPNDIPYPYWENGEETAYPEADGFAGDSKYTIKKLLYFGNDDPVDFFNSHPDLHNNTDYAMKGVYVRETTVDGRKQYQMWALGPGAQALVEDHYDVTNTIFIYFYPNQGGNQTAFYSKPGGDNSIMNIGYPPDYTGPQHFIDDNTPSTSSHIVQSRINVTPEYPYLFIAELYRDPTPEVDFGGIVASNMWIPAGEPKWLSNTLTLKYVHGDTWYQRYDCLKTYPFTMEDENSIVEVGSFLCETRINLDGRYDRNRGEVDNTIMSPINFNLLNTVYTQSNNFFNYRILDKDFYNLNKFSNQITWSKEKQNAADVDLWTNITMANTFDLDGAMGQINALRTWQDTIYCFQDNAISVISFNPRVQIPTSDGVPIEISNSYKLEGKIYISDSIGCSNKQTIAVTPSGIYFVDPNSKEFYHIAGKELSSISASHGFSDWFKHSEITNTFYDKNRNDVYVLGNNSGNKCIVYSELLGQFTSFMNYEGTPAMFNIHNNFYAFRNNSTLDMYHMFAGKYNNFFGTEQQPNYRPFYLHFISNADSGLDKIFSTIETRVDFKRNGAVIHDEFFNKLRVWNEYQDTGTKDISRGITAFRKDAKKKFRIWRVNIPRCGKHNLERIRNTWTNIKLGKDNPGNLKMELHDLNVQYFI